jgi:hypothetical protein
MARLAFPAMTYQAPPPTAVPAAHPGRQLARLSEALQLVERIAGRSGPERAGRRLDEGARLGEAYARALPVARRRFEALAAETSIWAAAGVEALLAAGEAAPRAAAARLARALDRALTDLADSLSR